MRVKYFGGPNDGADLFADNGDNFPPLFVVIGGVYQARHGEAGLVDGIGCDVLEYHWRPNAPKV